MSDKSIAYDQRLEDELERIKMRIWMNEELQIQPKRIRSLLLETYIKIS